MNGLLEQAPPAGIVAAQPLRIRHVDSLRAVAAGMVVWIHSAEVCFPFSAHNPAFLGFLLTLPRAVLLGRLGVDLFFVVSGFVICRSFMGPPEGSTQRFLIRRFCRLYPAFWVSIVAGVLTGQLEGHAPTLPLLAANATMVPVLFGQPFLIGLYWTLQTELAFYGLCLVLHWSRRLDSRTTLAICVVGLAAARRTLHLVGHFAHVNLDLPGEGGVFMISLALMCWGALFRSVYEETGGFRRAPLRCSGTWLLLAVGIVMLDVHDPRLKTFLFQQPMAEWGERLVTLNALVIFALWVAVLRVETRVLTYLGVISYSLYLFHPLVILLLTSAFNLIDPRSRPGLPLWLFLAVGTALSTALAAVIYRWVEHPAIGFGKRWVERLRLTKAGQPSEDPVR